MAPRRKTTVRSKTITRFFHVEAKGDDKDVELSDTESEKSNVSNLIDDDSLSIGSIEYPVVDDRFDTHSNGARAMQQAIANAEEVAHGNRRGTFLGCPVAHEGMFEMFEEPEAPDAYEVPEPERELPNQEMYKAADVQLALEWKPEAFCTGIVYPAPKSRSAPKDCVWNAHENAWINTRLQPLAPLPQPKGRALNNCYWEPSIGGWRRTKTATDAAIQAAQSINGKPQNFGNHLTDQPVFMVSITVGLRGHNLPPTHDDRLMAFLRQHAKNFHAGQENGNSKHDHRHWQIAAEFRLINDKSTATEMQDRIGEAIGLHKGHVPKRNIVVRICQGEEDAFNMLGYVQKEKNRGSYKEVTTFPRDLLDLSYNARQDKNMSSEEGKIMLTKSNMFKEAWRTWKLYVSPLRPSFTEMIALMVQSGQFALSPTITMGAMLDANACDAHWECILAPAKTNKAMIEMIFHRGRPCLLKRVPDIHVHTYDDLLEKALQKRNEDRDNLLLGYSQEDDEEDALEERRREREMEQESYLFDPLTIERDENPTESDVERELSAMNETAVRMDQEEW